MNNTEAAQKYMELIRSGVSAKDAFAQAWPNGLPTAQDQAKKAAKQQQSSALAQTGGLVGGVAASKAIADAITGAGWFANEAGSQLAQQAVNQTGQATIANATRTGASQLAPNAATPGLLSGWGSLGIGPQAGIVAGTALTAKGLYDLQQGRKGDPFSRGVTAMSTFGFSELGRALGVGSPSTRDIAKSNTKSLQNIGKDDANWQDYVQGMRKQYDSGPTDPTKPFAGKYGSWDEYKRAGLEASDLTGVYGNLKTFGPDWEKLSQDQRVAVTQGLINANLYDSKKGEVDIVNETEAKKIAQGILGEQPTRTTPAIAPSTARPTINPQLALAINKQNNDAQLKLAQSLGNYR